MRVTNVLVDIVCLIISVYYLTFFNLPRPAATTATA